MSSKAQKLWDDWVSGKQAMTALIFTLFFLSDTDAAHDDIYESMLAVVTAIYTYIKLDKKSQETTKIVSEAYYNPGVVGAHEETDADLITAHGKVHTELDKQNYLKRSWPWPFIQWSLALSIVVELIYGTLTIAAVEKALDSNAPWLKILLTVLGSLSPLILLTTSIIGSMVSVTHYFATEFHRLLTVRYVMSQGDFKIAVGSDNDEKKPLLSSVFKSHWFLSAFKAWDVKSWGLLLFIFFTGLSELLSLWNLLSQHEARTMADMELIFFLIFYACEMFFNVAQIQVSRHQQLENAGGFNACYFSDTKAGIALSVATMLIPLATKITQTVLFGLSDNPDNLNGWDCDTTTCDLMTGFSAVGFVFSLLAVYVNHRLETTRRALYKTSTGISDAFASFFKRVSGQECPAFEPVSRVSNC